MNLKYDILFRIRTRHEYYTSGLSEDIVIEPTPSCQKLLQRYGLICRTVENGVAIFTRVIPGTSPPQLFKSFSKSLNFSFVARLKNPHFYNITNLPDHKISKQVFHFTNLRDDQAGGEKYLSDHIDNQRVGTSIPLINRPVYNFRFDNPVHAVSMTLEDVFAISKTPVPSLNLQVLDATDAVQFDFLKVENMPSGRYTASYSAPLPVHAPILEETFYYEPGLDTTSALGIIEIFTDTLDFTNPSVDDVPADYHMNNGNLLTRTGADLDVLVADFFLRFEPRILDWQYHVIKKPENAVNTINLNNIGLGGGIAFDAPVISGDPSLDGLAVVRSTSQVTMSEAAPSIQLINNPGPGQTILAELPTPSLSQMLKQDSDDHFFEMYIYV